jgi:hypothetical protein
MDACQPAFGEAAKPKPWDLSVCAKCGTVTRFDQNFNMVALTPEQLQEVMDKSPSNYSQLMTVQRFINAKNKSN